MHVPMMIVNLDWRSESSDSVAQPGFVTSNAKRSSRSVKRCYRTALLKDRSSACRLLLAQCCFGRIDPNAHATITFFVRFHRGMAFWSRQRLVCGNWQCARLRLLLCVSAPQFARELTLRSFLPAVRWLPRTHPCSMSPTRARQESDHDSLTRAKSIARTAPASD
jgi:hypothetical protein